MIFLGTVVVHPGYHLGRPNLDSSNLLSYHNCQIDYIESVLDFHQSAEALGRLTLQIHRLLLHHQLFLLLEGVS